MCWVSERRQSSQNPTASCGEDLRTKQQLGYIVQLCLEEIFEPEMVMAQSHRPCYLF